MKEIEREERKKKPTMKQRSKSEETKRGERGVGI